MQTQIQNFIFKALQNAGEETNNELLKSPNLQTKIYGAEGNLDSLALVSFIADLEEMLGEIGIDIILADEKTMSTRNSPFKDVNTLMQYISQRC